MSLQTLPTAEVRARPGRSSRTASPRVRIRGLREPAPLSTALALSLVVILILPALSDGPGGTGLRAPAATAGGPNVGAAAIATREAPARPTVQTARSANGTPLAVTNFSVSPSAVVDSQLFMISVTAVGGVPPLTFAYDNLPVGCESKNGSEFSCVSTQSGHFRLRVQVTDVIGDVAYGYANLTVTTGHGAPPDITLFRVMPSTVQVFHPTDIEVAAVSESTTPSSVLAYTYFDLPEGCGSFNQTNLTCLPTQAGTFRIQVEVTDGFGAYQFAYATLNVTPLPSSPSSGTSYLTVAVLGLVAAAVVAMVAVTLVRRRKPPTLDAQLPPT